MSYGDNAKKLIGLKVAEFEIDEARQRMTLSGIKDGKGATFFLNVEGDCCSDSWIEDVFEHDALIGHTIIKVEDLELDGDPANGKDCERCGRDHSGDGYEAHDSLKFYGFAMITEAGRCVIDFRNDSNGYYGGWLEVRETTPRHVDAWEIEALNP